MTMRRATRSSLCLLAAALAATGCRPAPKDRIALVGATVVDGSGGTPMADMVVVVHGSRIESVTPRAGFKIPKTALVVDVHDRWIIPGLIDSHAHTQRWALARYAAFGVTTVRDLHSNQDSILSLREQVALGNVFGPTIFTAGAMIDGVPATYGDATAVRNDDQARRAVDARVVAGVEYLKVYTRITPDLLKAILDEAGNFRTTVAAHLGLTDAVTAATMGVRSIEHMTGVPEATLAKPEPLYAAHRQSFFAGWTAFEKSWSGLDSAALARTAARLAETRVVMVPTLGLHETYSRLDDPAVLASPDLKMVPDSELSRWNVPDMIARAGWKGDDFAAFRASRANQDLFLREFKAAGGTIAAGTDASNQMMVPGASEHDEMALLVAAGLTPGDALLAATKNGAQLLGADSLGRVAPGKVADLVILAADPLADITNTRKIDRVMLRGLLFNADSIRTHW
jgi:imidazolonepropionase-like amidohydrolase